MSFYGTVANFGQLPYSKVYHGQCTVSNVGDKSKVDLSYLGNIPEPAETLSIEEGQDCSNQLVKYSG